MLAPPRPVLLRRISVLRSDAAPSILLLLLRRRYTWASYITFSSFTAAGRKEEEEEGVGLVWGAGVEKPSVGAKEPRHQPLQGIKEGKGGELVQKFVKLRVGSKFWTCKLSPPLSSKLLLLQNWLLMLNYVVAEKSPPPRKIFLLCLEVRSHTV